MPFVRVHGNQLALVHGSRRDGKVVQEVLFTLYSKAEAREALGQGSAGGASHFETMLGEQHPKLSFNWPKLREEIAARIDHLPDSYDHPEARIKADFRGAMVAFLRQLLLADPQDLDVAAEVLNDQRQELEYVQHRLEWRLRMARERKPSAFTTDTPFLWRYQGRSHDVPHEADEEVHELYEQGKYDEVVARARLLTEAFPTFADGFNLLGLVALERGRHDEAILHFQKTIEVGRTLLPRHVRKDAWWDDHSTRPYMRGLGNLAITYNRAGRYEESLGTCDQLALCHDPVRVVAHRGPVLLNLGRCEEAAACFTGLLGLWPEHGYELGFALVATGRAKEARDAFVRALLASPRTALLLVGKRVPKAASRQQWQEDDRARTLHLNLHAYFARERRAALDPLRRLVEHPRVQALIAEIRALELQRRDPQDDRWRTAFDRPQVIQSPEFAERLGSEIG